MTELLTPKPMSKKTTPPLQRNTTQDKDIFNQKYLYLIAFVEGGSVMAIELAGAKMIAPFFGTSLYVWASVLAVTLGGLAAGYFAGGWATFRFPAIKMLFWELLAGTLLIALMPFLAVRFMSITGGLGLRLGSLLSSLSFMFLPLLCMGMISPTIIQLQNRELKGTGKTAGTIYAISTIGGITMTLLMGFYFLPEWGIRISVFFTAFLLSSMVILVALSGRKYKTMSAAGIFILVLLFLASAKSFSDANVAGKYLYRGEGVLGQITIVETQGSDPIRTLFLNQIPQTQVEPRYSPASFLKYPHRIAMIASNKPENSKALLIGLGGGNIAMELKKMGFSVDAIEYDKRMPGLAEDYFGFKPEGMNVYIDDGRHFIRTTEQKYDLVVIDVLNGEVQPHHMFTLESFAEMKRILEPDGMLIINNQGFLLGEHGLGARSVYKTLAASGFKVKYYFAGDETNSGDIHFIASPSDFTLSLTPPSNINTCCKNYPVDYQSLALGIEMTSADNSLDVTDAELLTDDKPLLLTLYNYSNEEWRLNTMKSLLRGQMPPPVTFFH
jgi:spermidine synthase